jgi:hypothetical protein
MKTLATVFRKQGFDYTQLRRTGDIAVYEQSQDGKLIAYEVFEVQKNEAREIAGVLIPASESVPGNNSWGKTAYTVWDSSEVPRFEAILQKKADDRFLAAQGTLRTQG